MEIAAYFAIVVIVGMVIGLASERASADFFLFLALAAFMLTGIIDAKEALSGFSNKGMITVAILFIVSAAVENTGALEGVTSFFLSKRPDGNISRMMLKMMISVSALSAFLNNTPIVIMVAPMIKKWASRVNLPASKFLIPLSYATIFGGVCTLIGTSTNLVVHGLMLSNGIKGISMFELGKVGLPCAIIGWLYLAFIGKRLLPDRKDMMETIEDKSREYIIEIKVQKEYEFIGKTIKEAGLRNLKGLYVIEIERDGRKIGPVSGDEEILENDILIFVGVTSAVVDLYEIKGLTPVEEEKANKFLGSVNKKLIEAVVSSSSPVIGQTVKECSFREQYGAGVIAVHRNGQRVASKVGSIKLKAGDTLLLLTSPDFNMKWKNSQDFYLVSVVKDVKPKPYNKAVLAISIVALMVLMATFGEYLPKIGGKSIDMFYAAFAAAILLIVTRCVHYSQGRNSIRWDVIITIACAFGISKGLQKSGAADIIATGIINIVKDFGPVGVLAGVYLLTTVFTEIITNNAAAALIFPVALSAANQMGVSPRPFFIAIAIAASASFATPIGYQTNLIVQGVGGYRFSDYIKVGVPLNILFWIASVLIIPIFWKF